MTTLKTGIDLVEISRLGNLQPAVRSRFINRVFTPLEIEQAGGSDASLAGRFAAKEAVAKALGTGIGLGTWQDIEVARGGDGQPELHLSGNALQVAEAQGVTQWSLSISHSKMYAVAMVVALSEV